MKLKLKLCKLLKVGDEEKWWKSPVAINSFISFRRWKFRKTVKTKQNLMNIFIIFFLLYGSPTWVIKTKWEKLLKRWTEKLKMRKFQQWVKQGCECVGNMACWGRSGKWEVEGRRIATTRKTAKELKKSSHFSLLILLDLFCRL